ncbi:MAG TPA: RNA methyltransferase [Gemmatimonadaceae bacterium]|nr:RNA methyltransferase [Gemmatimonadaceae bacterium]
MSLLTVARDLQRRKARERGGRFVAEGVRTIEELLNSGLAVDGILATDAAHESPRAAALLARANAMRIPVVPVTDREFDSAAGTDAPQGILAVAVTPVRSLQSLPATPLRLLVLDAVQDPGNVGTILRTAAAFDVSATIALPGTVDLWNAKVVRSAMGSHFLHPTITCTADALAPFLAERGIPLWGADAAGTPVPQVTVPPQWALAVGNEGAGLSTATQPLVAMTVALPISAAVESLNVAVATGILLFALR